MIDFAGCTFPDNQASIVCTHVQNGQPVLLYVHDSDGDIQFYCGEDSHSISDALALGLAEIYDHLRSMQDMPNVEPGYCAERSSKNVSWTVRKIND